MFEKELKEMIVDTEGAMYESKMLLDAIMFHRCKQGLTREELAKKSHVDLDTIEDMDKKSRAPSLYEIFMILHALGLTLTFEKYDENIKYI